MSERERDSRFAWILPQTPLSSLGVNEETYVSRKDSDRSLDLSRRECGVQIKWTYDRPRVETGGIKSSATMQRYWVQFCLIHILPLDFLVILAYIFL